MTENEETQPGADLAAEDPGDHRSQGNVVRLHQSTRLPQERGPTELNVSTSSVSVEQLSTLLRPFEHLEAYIPEEERLSSLRNLAAHLTKIGRTPALAPLFDDIDAFRTEPDRTVEDGSVGQRVEYHDTQESRDALACQEHGVGEPVRHLLSPADRALALVDRLRKEGSLSGSITPPVPHSNSTTVGAEYLPIRPPKPAKPSKEEEFISELRALREDIKRATRKEEPQSAEASAADESQLAEGSTSRAWFDGSMAIHFPPFRRSYKTREALRVLMMMHPMVGLWLFFRNADHTGAKKVAKFLPNCQLPASRAQRLDTAFGTAMETTDWWMALVSIAERRPSRERVRWFWDHLLMPVIWCLVVLDSRTPLAAAEEVFKFASENGIAISPPECLVEGLDILRPAYDQLRTEYHRRKSLKKITN